MGQFLLELLQMEWKMDGLIEQRISFHRKLSFISVTDISLQIVWLQILLNYKSFSAELYFSHHDYINLFFIMVIFTDIAQKTNITLLYIFTKKNIIHKGTKNNKYLQFQLNSSIKFEIKKNFSYRSLLKVVFAGEGKWLENIIEKKQLWQIIQKSVSDSL